MAYELYLKKTAEKDKSKAMLIILRDQNLRKGELCYTAPVLLI